MFEDFFDVVKKRFNGGADEEYKPPMFKCPRCQELSPLSRYEELHRVCPKCNYHGRLSAPERISITVDKDSFREMDADMISKATLSTSGVYREAEMFQESNILNDAVITGTATIKGFPVVVGVMDSRYMMGKMGSVVGEKITRAFEYATENDLL